MKNHEIASGRDIQAFQEKHPEWQHEGDALKAEFVFSDFAEAMQFMQQVGEIAEELNHHPEWSNVYNRVFVTLTTHDAGNQVTALDIRLATNISQIKEKY
jgi:4a-hydroxytetrahydrobiopterin dehydratase